MQNVILPNHAGVYCSRVNLSSGILLSVEVHLFGMQIIAAGVMHTCVNEYARVSGDMQIHPNICFGRILNFGLPTVGYVGLLGDFKGQRYVISLFEISEFISRFNFMSYVF